MEYIHLGKWRWVWSIYTWASGGAYKCWCVWQDKLNGILIMITYIMPVTDKTN